MKGLQLFWGHEHIVPLTYLNAYFKNNPIKLKISTTFKKGTNKVENWDYKRELKVYTSHFKHHLIYQTQLHEFNPTLLSTVAALKVTVDYDWYYFATLNNFYTYMRPVNSAFKNDKAQRFNFITDNETKTATYTSAAQNFYLAQGNSFKVGLDQAKWTVDFTKRYNQFQQQNAIANAVLSGLGGLVGGAGGGVAAARGINAEGNTATAGGAVAAVGGGLGLAGGLTRGIMGVKGVELSNEQRLKQAKYSVKKLEAQRADALKQPTMTNANDSQALAFRMVSRGEPAVQCYAPALKDWITLAYNYHVNGYGGTSFEKVNLNATTTRYYFNFWKISNIEQAVIKDTIPMMVVNHFNDLFNKGVRLWNVYNQGVVFNDYSKENWEIDYREILRS